MAYPHACCDGEGGGNGEEAGERKKEKITKLERKRRGKE